MLTITATTTTTTSTAHAFQSDEEKVSSALKAEEKLQSFWYILQPGGEYLLLLMNTNSKIKKRICMYWQIMKLQKREQ